MSLRVSSLVKSPICVDVLLRLRQNDFRLVNGVHVEENERLTQMVLSAGSAQSVQLMRS